MEEAKRRSTYLSVSTLACLVISGTYLNSGRTTRSITSKVEPGQGLQGAFFERLGGSVLSRDPNIRVVDGAISDALAASILESLPVREEWTTCGGLHADDAGTTCAYLTVSEPTKVALSSVTAALSGLTGAPMTEWPRLPVVRTAPTSRRLRTLHTDCANLDEHGQPVWHHVSVILYLTGGSPIHFPDANVSVQPSPGLLLAFDPYAPHYVPADLTTEDWERIAIQIPMSNIKYADSQIYVEASAQPFGAILPPSNATEA